MPALGAAIAEYGCFSCCPLPRPPISGDRGLFVQAPLHTHPLCRLGSLLFFSGRDIEDDLAPENVRSWEKETCWR
jgi:hypothetical protein